MSPNTWSLTLHKLYPDNVDRIRTSEQRQHYKTSTPDEISKTQIKSDSYFMVLCVREQTSGSGKFCQAITHSIKVNDGLGDKQSIDTVNYKKRC